MCNKKLVISTRYLHFPHLCLSSVCLNRLLRNWDIESSKYNSIARAHPQLYDAIEIIFSNLKSIEISVSFGAYYHTKTHCSKKE